MTDLTVTFLHSVVGSMLQVSSGTCTPFSTTFSKHSGSPSTTWITTIVTCHVMCQVSRVMPHLTPVLGTDLPLLLAALGHRHASLPLVLTHWREIVERARGHFFLQVTM